MSAALEVMNGLVLEDGRRWGDAAEPWQREDAKAVLDTTGAPYHFLTRGRGGSKTADLAGMSIAAMLTQAPETAKLYALAADRDQGRLFVDSIAGYVQRTPELFAELKVEAFKVSVPLKGVVLEVLAAEAPGAWGLWPWFVVVDEVCQWATTSGPRMLFEAVTSAVAKSTSARLILLSSAGDPSHWAARVLEHAESSPLWRVNEVPGPAPWLSEERLEEQRQRLPESSYRRLFLNQWTASEDRLVDPDDLAACVVLDGPQAPDWRYRYVIGLDVGIRHDATVATVCHLEDDRVVLDRFQAWQPRRGETVELANVEEWLDVTARTYRSAPIVFDPYQAIQLSQRLRNRGLRALEFTFSAQSVGRLAVSLHLLLRERRLALPADETLLDELRNVRLKETSPGVLRLDHDPDKHDDHAIALALAAHHLLEGKNNNTAFTFRYREDPYAVPRTGPESRLDDRPSVDVVAVMLEAEAAREANGRG